MDEGNVGEDIQGLIALSAALARRDPQRLREAMEAVVEKEDPLAVEEAILQSYLFLGYPIALNAFGLWREISGRGPGHGTDDDWDRWAQAGESVCKVVYGGQYEGLRRNVRHLHPDMERWMVVEGYGKVLARPGLGIIQRELCIAALLAVLGAPRQLYSHLRGALNAGADSDQVEEALRVASTFMDGATKRESWEVWERVRARESGAQGAEELDSIKRET